MLALLLAAVCIEPIPEAEIDYEAEDRVFIVRANDASTDTLTVSGFVESRFVRLASGCESVGVVRYARPTAAPEPRPVHMTALCLRLLCCAGLLCAVAVLMLARAVLDRPRATLAARLRARLLRR